MEEYILLGLHFFHLLNEDIGLAPNSSVFTDELFHPVLQPLPYILLVPLDLC